MTAKDNTLFEVRKHNDFSVLCSDDEEVKVEQPMTTETTSGSVAATATEASEAADALSGDGFETFTTVRKTKRVSQPKPAVGSAPRLVGKPKEVVIPKEENSIELYEFPSTLKTADLRKFLNDFDGHYRLKWINDTSCYVVFDDESLGKNQERKERTFLLIYFILL